MTRFHSYRDAFPNARLTRSTNWVLEIALHTDGGPLIFNGHTHEQFVEMFSPYPTCAPLRPRLTISHAPNN